MENRPQPRLAADLGAWPPPRLHPASRPPGSVSYACLAVRPQRTGRENRTAGFLFKLETLEGEPADPRELNRALPNCAPGHTTHFGHKTTSVVGVRDVDARRRCWSSRTWPDERGTRRGRETPADANPLARHDAGDVLERSANVVREERDRANHGESDDGQNHAVLRHRLPLLALCGDLHERKELQHLGDLPSVSLRRREQRATWASVAASHRPDSLPGSSLVLGALLRDLSGASLGSWTASTGASFSSGPGG